MKVIKRSKDHPSMADERMEDAEERDGGMQETLTGNEIGTPVSKSRKIDSDQGPSSSFIKEKQAENIICQGNVKETSGQAYRQGQIKQDVRLPTSPFITPVSSPIRASHPRFSLLPNIATWLQDSVAPLSPEPDSSLVNFFRTCEGGDITADITKRADVILGNILTLSAEHLRRTVGNQGDEHVRIDLRKSEAAKLYYRVLGACCRAESERLKSNNLTSLLKNERFQRCMLLCGAELVLVCHNGALLFPETLPCAGVTAFDVSKVLESFVRYDDTLPSELKRHLNSCEERILESLAWERGSSLYTTLSVARRNLFPEMQRLDLMPGALPSLEEVTHSLSYRSATSAIEIRKGESPCMSPPSITSPIQGRTPVPGGGDSHYSLFFRSPIKDRAFPLANFMSPAAREPSAHPHLHTIFASPQRPSPSDGGETCAEMQVSIFFRKVLKLAALRIRALCDRLQQASPFAEQVYNVVAHVLQQETGLFFNRHLDQIILSSIYGVCKVNHVSLAFKEIITQYRKQPYCKPQVFRRVLINQQPGSNPVTGDIIRFYNEVFVPSSKGVIVKLGSLPTPATGGSDNKTETGGSPFVAVPRISPQKVSASHNVFVSSMGPDTAEAISLSLLSPRTRQLSTLLGDTTSPFQSPGKNLAIINSRISASSRLGKLEFDEARFGR